MPTGNWLPETFKIKTKPIYFLTKAEMRGKFLFKNKNFEFIPPIGPVFSERNYVLSFACAKERTKEKHTGNDIQPLPSR